VAGINANNGIRNRLLEQSKKVYSDGAVIFREGEAGDAALELISGGVDLLVKRDGKYARERSIQPGEHFGTAVDTKSGIRIFTARANGRTVVRIAQSAILPAPVPQTPADVSGLIARLIQSFSGKPASADNPERPAAYSNPGLLRRLMDGMATDASRIGIRVARLSGEGGEAHSRHLISAIGNTPEIQTRSIEKVLSINPEADIAQQLERLAIASRRYLNNQGADLLIWGHVPEHGNVMHLHFVTHLNWDQQAPGAFDLETTLALPTHFEGAMADLLRTVCLAAVLPLVPEKKKLRATALANSIALAETAFEMVPPAFSDREKACLYLCYGNAIAATARPGYDPTLLAQAANQYRSALGSLSRDATPIDWAQVKKHLASINHIEAERNKDPALLNVAQTELEETLISVDARRQGRIWAAIQNRLGLIYYRRGFEDGDTATLRRALKCFQAALRVYTRNDAPARWAEIMSNFAQATQILGGLLQSPDALATAVNACLSVLEVRDRQQMPKLWAASQNNLGSALFLLGKQTRSIERLEASVAAFEQALAIYQMHGEQRLAITTAKNLDRAKDMVEFYQPRNSSQLDWEEALADEDIPGLTVTQTVEALAPPDRPADDDLPWPGEGLEQQAG